MKKLMLMACFVCASIAANASYLLWQVTDADYTEYTWDRAKLYIVEGETYSDSATPVSNVGYIDSSSQYQQESLGQAVYPSGSFAYVANLGDLGSSTTYSYYVELWNSSGEKVARSAVTTGTGATIPTEPYVYSSTDGIKITLTNLASVAPWHAGGYRAVPEPTSGLMLLLGAAMLGLKRKNRSIA